MRKRDDKMGWSIRNQKSLLKYVKVQRWPGRWEVLGQSSRLILVWR